MSKSVIHAYVAASRNKQTTIPKQSMPIFETIEEARQSLILEKGNHAYAIKESPVAINLFEVCWVQDNKLYFYSYKKKITGRLDLIKENEKEKENDS